MASAKISQEEWVDITQRLANLEKLVDGRIDQFGTLLHNIEARTDALEKKKGGK